MVLLRARAVVPRDAPDPAAASALQRPRAPAARQPGADRLVPRPRSPFSTPRGTRHRPASRASSLTCGSCGRAEVPPGLARAPGQRLHLSHPPASVALRTPPPRSGTRVFLLRASDVQPAALGRAPSCAQVETAREAPAEGQSQPPSANPGLQAREWGAPHLRFIHTCRRWGRRGQAPPRLRPSPAPSSSRRRRGRRRGQEEEKIGFRVPKQDPRCCVPPPSGPGGTQVSPLQRPPLQSAGIWWEKQQPRQSVPTAAVAYYGWERLAESELRNQEGAHLREPISPVHSPSPDLAYCTAEVSSMSDPCVCRCLLKTWLGAGALWCNWHSSKRRVGVGECPSMWSGLSSICNPVGVSRPISDAVSTMKFFQVPTRAHI